MGQSLGEAGRAFYPTPFAPGGEDLSESTKDGGRIFLHCWRKPKPSAFLVQLKAGRQLLALCRRCLGRTRAATTPMATGMFCSVTLLSQSLFISLAERGAGDKDELPNCSQALVFILAALYLDTCPWHCSRHRLTEPKNIPKIALCLHTLI